MSKKKTKQYQRTGVGTSDPIIMRDSQPLRIVFSDDKIHFENMLGRRIPVTNIRIKRGYQGKNKERTTLYFTNLPESALFIDAVATEFDVIYAVDTNTKEFNGKWYSVGVCFRGEPVVEDSTLKEILFRQCGVSKGDNTIKVDQIEQLVWIQMIQKIKESIDKDKRILMVVDSSLGHIDAFNSKRELLCGYYELPENVTLAYAKADVTDEWPNRIIRYCDQVAGAYLEQEINRAKEKMESCFEV